MGFKREDIISKGYAVEIKLGQFNNKYKDYSIDCTYQYDKNVEKYLLSMWLKRNDIGDKFRIQEQEVDTQYIPGTRETIRTNIWKLAAYMAEHEIFDKYVERYEYTLACFEAGYEIVESNQ